MSEDTQHGAPSRRVNVTGDVEVGTYLEIAKEKAGFGPPEVTDSAYARETVAVIDFGSQYSRLIARRVREAHVYCEILPHDAPYERVRDMHLKGVILSGGPHSVYEQGAPLAPSWVFDSGVPVLGICYGMQSLAHQLGGRVAPGQRREYGHAVLHLNMPQHKLFRGMPPSMPVWMSHGDHVLDIPQGFRSLAYTDNSPVAVMGTDTMIGLQFHPEVVHTPQGRQIIENFLLQVCGCHGSWTPENFISQTVSRIREEVGDGKVICALSGGVDSAVAATLVHRAIGDQLTCIFVNNGLLRREEPERVMATFGKQLRMNIVYVDAADRFLARLEAVADPEQKRKIVGEEFIRIFEEEADRLGHVDFLAQGTLYPDVIESTSSETRAAAKIKTHHNVGGLPKWMRMRLIEPLRYLFKDEVREAGLALGLPPEMVNRQPFPGPGLSIRIIGPVDREKLEVLRGCDWIVMDEIKAAGLYGRLWQSFAILTDTRSVGVQGDYRTYGHVVAVRAVTSDDAMTADWARLPYEVLARISGRIVNEVQGVNRVVYDVTSKPPGTIEWE